MVTAHFSHKTTSGRTVYGKVTLKDDGKVSINIANNSRYSYSERLQAKNIANAIVKSNFVHEAIDGSVEKVERNDKLIEELYKHTSDLKAAFIEKTKEYADERFAYCEKLMQRTEAEWLKAYRIEYTVVNKYGNPNYHEYNHRLVAAQEMERAKIVAREVVRMGLDKYKASKVKQAEEHYTESIIRLAKRLNDKGITANSKFTIHSARVGVNFECYIHHENGITKAWTIIASGPVQQPHYRYLVK